MFSQRKQMNLTKIFMFFEDLSKKQINESIMAIRKAGPYQISRKYFKFEVDPHVWETYDQKKKDKWVKNFLESEKLNVSTNSKIKKEYGFHVKKDTKNKSSKKLVKNEE